MFFLDTIGVFHFNLRQLILLLRVALVVCSILTCLPVMSIPFLIIRRIRVSSYQKLGLSAVFSLVIITMIFAVIRAAITTIGVKRQIDPLWMYLWTSVELNIGKGKNPYCAYGYR